MPTHQFKARYFYRFIRRDFNPLTPDRITVTEQTIQHKRRNWYLISCDTQTYHFQNIIGVDVDKGIFGANIVIRTTGNGVIYACGFSKRKSNEIVGLCSQFIAQHTQRNLADQLRNSISSAPNNNPSNYSLADELKKLKQLLEEGIITQTEFENQKNKLLN
jgi:hypothetical protein